MKKLPNGRRRVMYLDNCSGHNPTKLLAEAANEINTEIRYFPKNDTHLIQPCDSFEIQKRKSAWLRRWEENKLILVRDGMWSNSSGKLPIPGKSFFLRLAADSIREVNGMKEEEGINYARKIMIRPGMALNLNGQWEERKSFPQLQQIMAKFRNHFDAQPVVERELKWMTVVCCANK